MADTDQRSGARSGLEGITPGAGGARLGYQPALDGVRAVAIALVVAFHLDLGRGSLIRGGFMGVDVFFVLSGFLITSLLLDERAATGGIRLRAFWARRAARLLPLLAVVLAIAAVDRWLHPIKGIRAPTPLGFVAIIGYVGNWVSVTGRHSFGSFEYVWSLAVEEQFYLVWPLVVALVVARRRRGRSATPLTEGAIPEPSDRFRARVAVVSGLGAVTVAAVRAYRWKAALHWNAGNGFMLREVVAHRTAEWNAWFFGTGLRADGLLLGATLAATRRWWQPRITGGAAAAAVALLGATIATYAISTSEVFARQVPSSGVPTLVVGTALLVAGLIARPRGGAARLFALRPFVWLGRRSYAAYLLHLPVLLAIDGYFPRSSDALRAVVGTALAILAAHVAHHTVELPAQRVLRRVLGAEHRAAEHVPSVPA